MLKKGKRWLAGFLAVTMTAQTVTVAVPAEVKAQEGDYLFHDFEGDSSSIVVTASGSLTTDEAHDGEQSLAYERNNSANKWNVEIESKEGTTVDLSDYKYITFWLKESGSAAMEVKFIDESGKETKVRTPMAPTANEWSFMSVPISSFDFSKVDKTAIKKIAFWDDPDNTTYYIDDIILMQDLPADESTSYNGTPVLLTDFESGNDKVSAKENALVSIEDGVGVDNSKAVVYEKTASGSPDGSGSVLLSAANPVDTTGLRYLVFYIKDTQGSNNMMLSLQDADGKESSFSWTSPKSTKNKYVQYYVPLSSIAGDIDRTKITGVRIGEWNAGTFYIDNIYFDNYLFTGVPGTGEGLPSLAEKEVGASVKPGYFTEGFSVELYANSGEFIYYTTDGSEPKRTASCQYNGAINVSNSTTIKAFASKDGESGETKTFEYKIVPYPVTATSKAGTYDEQVVVEFRTKSDKDLIYYTTDGTTPAKGEGTTQQFIKPMLVTDSTTFKVVAYKPGSDIPNEPVDFTYTINKSGETALPVFSKPEGTYGSAITLELTGEGEIYYTTDGSEPTESSDKYEEAITVDKSMTVKAVAVKDGKASDIVSAEYTLDSEATPFLKADGKVLKDNYGTGDTITLRGTNAGGWLVTEDWQCPTNAKDQLTAQKVFTERFGTEKAQELIDLYQDNWWTEADFDLVKEEGMNVLRLPVTYFEMLKEDGSLKDSAFDRMEWFIENCEKRGIYVLIDMHGAVGSQNGKDHSGDTSIADVGNFYGNEENIEKTIELWKAIVEKYKDNPWVCGYDLLNEPSAVGTPQFEVYDRIYDAIRAIDKNHVIYIQSIWEPTHLPDPSFYGWENVAYEYHFYGWDVEKDAEGQKKFIQSKEKMVNEDTNYNVPLLVGEFTFFSNTESWKAMDIFEEQGWNYTSWTWKVSKNGSSNSWGMYTVPSASDVDIYNDSFETIKEKWAPEKLNTDSESFTRNNTYADILKGYFANNAKNKPDTTDAESISIAADKYTMEMEDTFNLDAKVLPENTAYKALHYTVDKEDVVSVDNGGVVTAKAEGTAVITVTNLYGMTKTCTVTVLKKTDNVNQDTGKAEAQKELAAAIKVATDAGLKEADYTAESWKAYQDALNAAKALDVKTATADQIEAVTKALTDAQSKLVKASETVKTIPATKLTLNTKKLYIVKGKSIKVKAVMTPSDTTDEVTWNTSKKSVATVSSGKIKAKKVGNAKITATTTSGKKATIKVYVVKKAKKSTSIKLNKKKATVKKGSWILLTPTLKPAKSTDTVSWKSSNKKVASVDAYGFVTAKKKGKATITATTKSGKKKVTCKITVK